SERDKSFFIVRKRKRRKDSSAPHVAYAWFPPVLVCSSPFGYHDIVLFHLFQNTIVVFDYAYWNISPHYPASTAQFFHLLTTSAFWQ
ncbi:MAG: hypothetical protein AAB344_06025, partial [Bacteroidota bacterium]